MVLGAGDAGRLLCSAGGGRGGGPQRQTNMFATQGVTPGQNWYKSEMMMIRLSRSLRRWIQPNCHVLMPVLIMKNGGFWKNSGMLHALTPM